MRVDIYGDNIGYVTDEVSELKPCEANLNEENRIKFVTDLAAISRGKNKSNNPNIRYKSLMKETRLGYPSRPLEFLPVVLELKPEPNGNYIRVGLKDELELVMDNLDFFNKVAPFSYIEQIPNIYENYQDACDQFFLFTNMRCLINAGFIYEQIPYANNVDKQLYTNFKAIKANVPMFVWSQIMTHTQLSKVSQSDRVSENSNYWLPDDIHTRLNKDIMLEYDLRINDSCVREAILDHFLNYFTQADVQAFLKDLGYPREIYNRAPYYFKYKEFIITGWYNNKRCWYNMLVERNAITTNECNKNWTQKETNIFANAVNTILNS